MTDRMSEERFDRELRAFLALQAEDLADAPTAAEAAVRIGSRAGIGSARLRVSPQLVWVLLAGLLLMALAGALVLGAALKRDDPAPIAGPANGWIAFSTQPGTVQVGGGDSQEGGDIYLVREGVEPRKIVGRGAAGTSNVCPIFSPDGSKLAYGERSGTNREIVIVEVAGDGSVGSSTRLNVADGPAAPCPAWWSADGTRIIYLAFPSATYSETREPVAIALPLDDSPPVAAAGDPSVDELMAARDGSHPLQAPTGEWTVANDCCELVVTRPNGSERRVIGSPGYSSVAAWSPDGRYVLTMEDVGGFRMLAWPVDPPFKPTVVAPSVPVNGQRSWPGRGDVSWQRTATPVVVAESPLDPAEVPDDGPLDAGTYALANPCIGACPDYQRIWFAVPPGWSMRDGFIHKNLDTPAEVAFKVWTVDEVYADPCRWQTSARGQLDIVEHDHDASGTLLVSPGTLGLRNQAGRSSSSMTQVTLGGQLAMRLELSVPESLYVPTCDQGEYRSWTEFGPVDGANRHIAPGQVDVVYEIDVDRRPLVIDATHGRQASEADLAELEAILASMVIDR